MSELLTDEEIHDLFMRAYLTNTGGGTPDTQRLRETLQPLTDAEFQSVITELEQATDYYYQSSLLDILKYEVSEFTAKLPTGSMGADHMADESPFVGECCAEYDTMATPAGEL